MKEKISDSSLILEYEYSISLEEYELFNEVAKKLEGNIYDLLNITGFLYYIVLTLGTLMRRIFKEKLFVALDCAFIKKEGDNRCLKFIVLVRKSRDFFFENYLKMTSFYFLKQFKGIPEDYYDKLISSREELYKIALENYNDTKERLVDLLYYFYRKCKLLENFCPILDLLNFVCSRVEDSTFSKDDIIKRDFLVNFDYSVEKKNSIIKIFDFLDKKSTLYSTFQANNLPSPRAQYNLFILLVKYFFSTGLEVLEVGDLLLLPEVFKTRLNRRNKEGQAIGSKSIKNIGIFTNYLSMISNVENLDLFFKKIFNSSISNLNYQFFRTFLKSYNTRLATIIDEENNILAENSNNELLNFDIVVDHICRIIYVLIDKIFLRENPDDASINFIDPRGRYVGKNIALRVLELFVFQEINFSDDIWPEYLISINKNKIIKSLDKYINIDPKYFYSDLDLLKFSTIYNLKSFTDEMFFEEWLIDEIIVPLNRFILKIKKAVKDPANNIEVYEELSNVLLCDITDKGIIKDLKYISKQIAPFWELME